MRIRDFLLLMAVCFIWALNVIVGRIMLTNYGVPPLYYAGIRFLGVALLLSPLLLPMPTQIWRIVIVCLLMGAGHFGFLFVGLQTATASSAAITLQLGIPMTAILSIVILGEHLSPSRIVGIATAFLGILAVIWNPAEAQFSIGLIAIIASATSLAFGSVLLKKFLSISSLRLQAWVGLISWAPLMVLSAILESNQKETSQAAGSAFLVATAFSVIIATVVAHTCYFSLLRRYDASTIVPLTLAMPIFAIILGVFITGDSLTPGFVVGSVACILGVTLVSRGNIRRSSNAEG